jgi:Tfp pilus assembly protein PilE
MILQAITKRQSRRKMAGLTLIEMMLVVTIIAVATLTGIKLLKNRAAATAIDTVVTQMQSVAQAVIEYYMTNQNQWPTSSTTASSLTGLADVTAKYMYLSQQTLCTPFPANNSSAFCKNFATIEGQSVTNAGYYNLVLTTDSNSSALAIAGKLPNATASGSIVTMSVTPPSQYFVWNPNKGWIVSAGVTSFTQKTGASSSLGSDASGSIFIPNCPAGFEGHIMFSPERYQTLAVSGVAQQTWGIHMAEVTSDGSGKKDDNPQVNQGSNHSVVFQTGTDSHGNLAYAVTVGDQPDSYVTSAQHLAFYMTFCLPIGHWGANFINTDWPQDGQCSDTWKDFLETQNDTNYTQQCNAAVTATWKQNTVGSPNGY